jgi:hypothetical protein
MRLHVLVGFVVLGGAVGIAACGGETDTPFGPADGLYNTHAPQPGAGPSSSSGSSGGGSNSSSSGSSSSSSGGGGSASGGSSGGSSSGTTGDGGSGEAGSGSGGGSGSGSGGNANCPSWANTVFPALQNDGTCGSSTACHANGGQQPVFINGNATATYNQFTQYTQLEGKPYVKTGDTNANDSTIDCSLDTQTCFTTQKMPPVGTWTAADKTLIQQWVACGAPNN